LNSEFWLLTPEFYSDKMSFVIGHGSRINQ
jgi:hypothetical protein